MKNEDVVRDFFAAFGQRDYVAMTRHYQPDAAFEDPVFGKLTYEQIAQMWKMLCLRGKDLKIELISCQVDADRCTAEWEATYTFSQTGRFVRNRVRSVFFMRDGKIAKQDDSFNFWNWSSQALGIAGRALGWTPFMKNALRKNAKRSLETAPREG
jgi:ketosteroid isomerase-like protein